MLVDRRCIGADRSVSRVLAVEDAQRIALEPREAVFRQLAFVRAEVIDQGCPPRIASLWVAERVELEGDAFADAQLLKQLMTQAQDLHIRLRFGGADDL